MKFLMMLTLIASSSAMAAVKQPLKQIKRCQELVKEDSSVDAKKFCAKKNSFQFIDNKNLDRCLEIIGKDNTPSAAIDLCVEKTQSIDFAANANLNICISIYQEFGTSLETLDQCQQKITTFDYAGNLNFQACFERLSKTLLNNDAAEKCIEMSKSFDFTTEVFSNCFTKTNELKLAHHALDICVEEISGVTEVE